MGEIEDWKSQNTSKQNKNHKGEKSKNKPADRKGKRNDADKYDPDFKDGPGQRG
jgi:hypothetical protein